MRKRIAEDCSFLYKMTLARFIAVLQTVFSILAASFGAMLVKTTILGTNSTPKNDFDKVYRSKSTAIYTEHSYENCFKRCTIIVFAVFYKVKSTCSDIHRVRVSEPVKYKIFGYEEYKVI